MQKRILIALIFAAVAGLLCSSGLDAGAATTKGAGSQNDPVVSLSYLEYRLSKLENGGKTGNTSSKVTLERGKRLMPGEGKVVVVYSGACTVVGKAVDTTSAALLSEGSQVPLYSQILLPDGSSGVVASETTVVYIVN